MSVENFKPAIWRGEIIFTLRKTHVHASVANSSFSGDISSAGDRVKLNQVGDVTINTYTPNSTSITPQALTDAQRELIVDQQKYFAFYVEDVDQAQANVEFMNSVSEQSAYGLRDTADQYLAGLYQQNGLTYGTNSVPIDVNSTNVEETVLTCGETMTENNVMMENRYMVIAPWFHTKLVLAGIANLSDNVDLYRNGRIGSALGFDFRVSVNVSKDSATTWAKTRQQAGILNQTLGWAEQIVSIEAYRPESGFQDAVKGYHVYGGKVTRPDKGLTLYADKTDE
jgi:hypothetical protein